MHSEFQRWFSPSSGRCRNLLDTGPLHFESSLASVCIFSAPPVLQGLLAEQEDLFLGPPEVLVASLDGLEQRNLKWAPSDSSAGSCWEQEAVIPEMFVKMTLAITTCSLCFEALEFSFHACPNEKASLLKTT